MKSRACLALCCAAIAPARAAAPDLSTFQLDPRLKIELFASEPDVVDPVALTFDAAGRLYVVEMRDYPYGIGPEHKPGGTIRLLEDTDGDGNADKSTVFARELSFPTSIAPWSGGVFVTAPPEILYLKDTDGDGVADLREVYFTGFAVAATDSNANGLRWGLDNRIHGINGGNGGTIQPSKGTRTPVGLGDADFSFDPKNSELETTFQTSGGFGLVFDEFGHSFSTHNINHIQQRIVPLRYLDRLPGMLPVNGTASISDHGEMARLFPISVPQTRPNHPEQAGLFSSAGGLGFIGYDLYPGDLYRSVTVGDVVGNLIHRDVLQDDGPVYLARRSASEAQREFLSSRDPACRLVGLELGPDGALYAIDMQRDVIEHPDYIPEKIRATQDIRAGDDRGRIYRISPKSGLPREQIQLATATPEQLAAELGHRNQWRRQTAQRLIVEKRLGQLAPRIRRIATEHAFAPARVNALWTLAGLGRLDTATLGRALLAENPGVRENAILLFENISAPGRSQPGSLGSAAMLSFQGMLPVLLQDTSPRVLFQLALTLGGFGTAEAETSLVKLLLRQIDSPWIRTAVYSGLRSPIDAFAAVIGKAGAAPSPADLSALNDLASLAISRTDLPASRLSEILALAEKSPAPVAVAALQGLDLGFSRRGSPPPHLPAGPALARIAERDPSLFDPAWSLHRRLGLSETPAQRVRLNEAIALLAGNAPHPDRLRAIRSLRFGGFPTVREPLLAQLGGSADAELQRAALAVLANFRDPGLAEQLVRRWPGLAPSARPPVLNLLLSRRGFHDALMDGIESGALKLGELNLDLEQRRMLLRRSSPEIQARAAKFIGDEEYSHRKALVNDWIEKLPATGNPAQGRGLFEKLCAQCHRAGALGVQVGPDLSSVAHRSAEDLLFNILDPAMAVNPAFAAYNLETLDGELLTGIVAQDTPGAVTLLQAGAIRTVVPRSSIKSLRTTGGSLMPEGLEAGLTPADLRDLIAFLHAIPPEP